MRTEKFKVIENMSIDINKEILDKYAESDDTKSNSNFGNILLKVIGHDDGLCMFFFKSQKHDDIYYIIYIKKISIKDIDKEKPMYECKFSANKILEMLRNKKVTMTTTTFCDLSNL